MISSDRSLPNSADWAGIALGTTRRRTGILEELGDPVDLAPQR